MPPLNYNEIHLNTARLNFSTPRKSMSLDALRLLKYVLAAIEHGSMRRVAQALGVQESTVSRNISAFEQHLDIQLFERHSQGVRLTEEGERWLETTRSHIDGLEDVLLQAAHRNKGIARLRIGLCAPVGQEFLFRLIDRFRNKHPEIDVTIRDGSCHRHATAIRRRYLDIAFMCGCCEVKGCSSETIWEEGISVLLPGDHRLAKHDMLTWEELAGERLLVPIGAEGPQLDPCFLRRITTGSSAPIVEQCHASQATVLVKVRLGKGFALAGTSFARATAIENTVWRPITGRNSSCPVKAVWLESNPKRAVLHVVAIARNMAEERKAKLEASD